MVENVVWMCDEYLGWLHMAELHVRNSREVAATPLISTKKGAPQLCSLFLTGLWRAAGGVMHQ